MRCRPLGAEIMRCRASLLFDYLSNHKRSVMRPGLFDCAIFAGGWVQVVTGRDLIAEWQGAYKTIEQGREQLAAAGFADLSALAAHHLTPVANTDDALAGDIALIRQGADLHFGIVGGTQVYVLRPIGLDVVLLTQAGEVFRP